MRLARALFCAAAMAAVVAPGARADEYTKTTHLTFSGPVQLPGITLPAGTYTFKLADPNTGRTAIQVWDKDARELLTTLLTIPDQLLEPVYEPVVLFREQPAGAPQAIKSWFYPGERIGMEFIYPRDQAMEIAKATREPVLAYNADADPARDLEAARQAEVGRVDGQGRTVDDDSRAAAATTDRTTATAADTADAQQPAQSADADAAPSRPSPSANRTESGAPSAVGTAGQAGQDPTDRDRSGAQPTGTTGESEARTLPQTASSTGLLGLLSVLSIGGAVGLRQVRRRVATVRSRR